MAAPPPLSFLADAPSTAGAQQEASCAEESLAELVAAVANNDVLAGDAIQRLVSLTRDLAQASRQRGHSAAKSWLLETTAAEQEAQADTWSLLHHLYCTDSPVRQGGGLPDGTGMVAATSRQRLADLIAQDPALDRCARVVAWLEHMAAEQLQAEPSAGFAAGEGLPMSTLARADGAAVDPDAACREGAQLAAADMKNNERILQHVWKLIRAGRFQDAVQLARQVGQSWRAAGLLGGGPLGALPLGPAAELQSMAGASGQAAEELAAELEHGTATPTAAWKWSCWQASSRGDSTHLGGRHERAVYGALCGNLAAMLPACASWEDAAWAHCRAWLDLHSHRALHADARPREPSEVSVEEVVGALQRVAGGRFDAQVVADAMRLGQPDSWPPQELLEGVAGGLEEVFADSLPALQDKPAIQQACAAKYHLLQVQLVLQQHVGLVRGEVLEALQEEGGSWQLPPAFAPSAGVTRQYLLLRFGAHLALMLRALGQAFEWVEVAGSSVMDADEAEGSGGLQLLQHFQPVAEATDKVVVLYCAHLMESGLQHLVPHYALHCSAYHRSRVLQQLLHATTWKALAAAANSPPLEFEATADASCQKVWSVLSEACSAAQQRQAEVAEAAAQPDAPVSDQPLPTQLLPNELQVLLRQAAQGCMASSSSSPTWRVRLHRWLFYPYLDFRHAPQHPLLPTDSPATAPFSLPVADTLRLACLLACGPQDPHCQAAANLLWQQVVPPEFTERAAGELDEWAAAATAHEAMDEVEAHEVGRALEAAGAVRDGVEELDRLLLLLRHASAARDWLQAAEGLQQRDAGQQLLDEALLLLEGGREVLQPNEELLAALTAAPFLRLWLTTSSGKATLDPLEKSLPSLQGAAVAQLEEQVASAIASWHSSNAEGAPGLVASRLSLHTEADGGSTLLLLELQAQDSSLQALEQLLLLPAVLLGSGGAGGPALLVTKLEGTPQLDVLLAERILAGQLLLEAQQLRLRLLGSDASVDPAAGLAERLAEPSTPLSEVAECLPREVLQQFLLMEAEVELLALRAAEGS